jgi:hypothetical protein
VTLPRSSAGTGVRAQPAAFNAAGGIRYHVRARLYSKSLWQPFRWALGEWLLRWAPPEPNLLLIGPSAGYNLHPLLFERFERVSVLEPDPIARHLFRRRLHGAKLSRQPQLDFIAGDHLIHHPERLVPLLERLGQPALLFSNVLGQLVTLLDHQELEGDRPDPELDAIKNAVRSAIDRRSFCSFHDRVSGSLPPGFAGMLPSDHRWSDAEVVRHAYDVRNALPRVELHDHSTEGLFPARLPHSYFHWQLSPGQHHLIEGVCGIVSRQAEPASL